MIFSSLTTISNYAQTSFSLAIVTIIIAFLLTPIYTHVAYKYKFWKSWEES